MSVLLEQLLVIVVQFVFEEFSKHGLQEADAIEAMKKAMTVASEARVAAKYPNG